MAEPPLVIADDRLFDAHAPPHAHPERPDRLAYARRGLQDAQVPMRMLEGRDATRDELMSVHGEAYLDLLDGARGRDGFLDADTYYCSHSVGVAVRAAGHVLGMVDALMRGEAHTGLMRGEAHAGLALVRPPGHHAGANQAMGFCILNHIALGAARARQLGANRVFVLDWDVHHGNGTQEIFETDPSVLFASLHQSPLYPGTGAATETGRDAGEGYTVNIPLSAGAGREAYWSAFTQVVLPVLEQFRPDLLLISAGFDAHRNDPLGSMKLDAGDYGMFLNATRDVLPEGSAMGLVLEGGYDLEALRDCVRVVAQTASGVVDATVDTRVVANPLPEHAESITQVRRIQSKYWRLG